MRNPEASICTPEGVVDFKAIANFQDYHGLPEFRNVSHYENLVKSLSVFTLEHAKLELT